MQPDVMNADAVAAVSAASAPIVRDPFSDCTWIKGLENGVPTGVDRFDPLDPAPRRCPWPWYEWLHRQTPRVYAIPGEGNAWAVSHYEDVQRVLRDTDTFTGNIFHDEPVPLMVALEGQAHRRMRDVVQAVFTPKGIRKLEPVIREVASQRTAALLDAGRCDLVQMWSNPIPLTVIAEVIGYPRDHIDLLYQRGRAANRTFLPLGGTDTVRPRLPWRERLAILRYRMGQVPLLIRLIRKLGWRGTIDTVRMANRMFRRPAWAPPMLASAERAQGLGAVLAFLNEIMDIVHAHMAKPGDEVVDLLIEGHRDGRLSRHEMMITMLFLLIAGYETTAATLANAVALLARHPELYAWLRQDVERIPGFVEEVLRIEASIQRTVRRAKVDTEIAGVRIPKNSLVVVLLGAANVDAARFENPFTFDPERHPKQTMTFGHGAHYCLGAPLARLEAKIALEALVATCERIEIDRDAPPALRVTDWGAGFFGFDRLPVIVHAR
ncbi:MAG: cytochrome P450 [Candidatus Dadabacteria bacterium]|nr:MAG: cytochrome P450 [Candidatus Dadabacteria bacterium]